MALSAAERTRLYRKRHKERGLCYDCPRKRSATSVLCARCLSRTKRYGKRRNVLQRENRIYRQLIGMCTFCRRPSVGGVKYCVKHRVNQNAAVRRYKEKKMRERGWRMMKVKI